MILAKQQQHMLWKSGTGWEVPARVLNAIFNGPGFYFGPLIPIPVPYALNGALSFDGDRILGVALFWFLIGLSIDRRIGKRSLDTRHPIRAGALFACAALICCVFAYGGLAYVFCPSPDISCWEQGPRMAKVQLGLVAEYPLRTSAAMALYVAVWILAFCAYFVKRAFTALRRISQHSRPSVR